MAMNDETDKGTELHARSVCTLLGGVMEGYWYNFFKGKYEYLETPPEHCSDYIPQDPGVQSLYQCYIALGDTSVEAAIKVLKVYVGEEPTV